MPVPVTIVCPDTDECSALTLLLLAHHCIALSVRTATFVGRQYTIVRQTGNPTALLSTLAAPCTNLSSLAVSLIDMTSVSRAGIDLLREAGAFRHLRQLRLYPGGGLSSQLSSESLIKLLHCMPQLRCLLIHAPLTLEHRRAIDVICNRLQLEEYFCSHPTLMASTHIISSSRTSLLRLRIALDILSPYHGLELAAILSSLSSLRALYLDIWPDNDKNALSPFRDELKAAFRSLTQPTSLTVGIYLASEREMFDELLHDSPMMLRSLSLRPSDKVELTDDMEEWLKGLPERHRALAQLRTLSVWVSHETIHAMGRPRLVQFRRAIDARLARRRIAFEFAV